MFSLLLFPFSAFKVNHKPARKKDDPHVLVDGVSERLSLRATLVSLIEFFCGQVLVE